MKKKLTLPKIYQVPPARLDEFPMGLVGANIEEPDKPDPSVWVFEFKAIHRDGSQRWCVWQIPGFRNYPNEVGLMLRERAAKVGVKTINLYNTRKPPTQAEMDFIEQENARLDAGRQQKKAV